MIAFEQQPSSIAWRPFTQICSIGRAPLPADVDASHSAAVAVVTMNGLFLVGLTYRVITKRFAVAWDAGAIAAVYVTAVSLAYVLRG